MSQVIPAHCTAYIKVRCPNTRTVCSVAETALIHAYTMKLLLTESSHHEPFPLIQGWLRAANERCYRCDDRVQDRSFNARRGTGDCFDLTKLKYHRLSGRTYLLVDVVGQILYLHIQLHAGLRQERPDVQQQLPNEMRRTDPEAYGCL
ncbi:hypothetical protein EVAR_10048_1 [Eumeta japonica]|uniref:Uncharacterized protein n=1 Tax=Eumeta variegata TaxID=151549 RepID=A0A4C1TR60_EUMVA|nr:hypothetical protein EVAR_10048_1 [Eumeta japonica]